MPRNNKNHKSRKRKPKGPPVGVMNDIAEQLRIQRLAAQNRCKEEVEQKKNPVAPPAHLGKFVYDSKRNAYFPRGTIISEDEDSSVDQPILPSLPRRFISPLYQAEICSRPSERRRIMHQWRGRNLKQNLSMSIVPGTERNESVRTAAALWQRSFTWYEKFVGEIEMFHIRQQGEVNATQNALIKQYICQNVSMEFLDLSCFRPEWRPQTLKTLTLDENERHPCFVFDISESKSYFLCPTQSQFNYSSDHALGDFCYSPGRSSILLAAVSKEKSGWLCVGDHRGIEKAPSEVLCLESMGLNLMVVSGHRNGLVSLRDPRFCPGIISLNNDSDVNSFGNVVALDVADSDYNVVARAASGSCRLLDTRTNNHIIHEFTPPTPPAWVRSVDTVCKGMAVDPLRSTLLLPQPMEEQDHMGVGLWSLLTGEYLGTSECSLPTRCMELSPTVGRSVLHRKPIVMADLGSNGVAEIQLDGRSG